MPDTEKTMTQFLSLRDSQPSGKWPPGQSGDKEKMKRQRVTDYKKQSLGSGIGGEGELEFSILYFEFVAMNMYRVGHFKSPVKR